jgi:23S rRNA pseudouridine2457 synthase
MRYLALHKPYNVLSSFTHESQGPGDEGKRTLSEFDMPKGVYAAGRLDFDSEGLLVLSDDGGFIHRMTDPRFKLAKTYWAQVEGTPTESALMQMRAGLRIKDYITAPCQARQIDDPGLPPRDKPVTPHGPTAWLELILTEGKKRQVRHMTAAIGLPTLRLLRVAIGPIHLGALAPGQWRDLTKEERPSIIPTRESGQRARVDWGIRNPARTRLRARKKS